VRNLATRYELVTTYREAVNDYSFLPSPCGLDFCASLWQITAGKMLSIGAGGVKPGDSGCATGRPGLSRLQLHFVTAATFGT
jgi:hypothetical protein